MSDSKRYYPLLQTVRHKLGGAPLGETQATKKTKRTKAFTRWYQNHSTQMSRVLETLGVHTVTYSMLPCGLGQLTKHAHAGESFSSQLKLTRIDPLDPTDMTGGEHPAIAIKATEVKSSNPMELKPKPPEPVNCSEAERCWYCDAESISVIRFCADVPLGCADRIAPAQLFAKPTSLTATLILALVLTSFSVAR